MSVLFPKLNKPRQWDYRPIYYDEQKEKQQKLRRKLEELRGRGNEQQSPDDPADALTNDDRPADSQPYVPTLHRGSFREARELGEEFKVKSQKQSKFVFFIAILFLLLFFYWLLK